jgi:5-oxoprolinase (ATP-hydrolysing)
MGGKIFEIYVDTGGTFTDCMAKDSHGRWIRRKVLSNGSLRGVIKEWLDCRTLTIEENWALDHDIIRGYQFCLLKRIYPKNSHQSPGVSKSVPMKRHPYSEPA